MTANWYIKPYSTVSTNYMEKIQTNFSSYITVASKTAEELIEIIDCLSFTIVNLQVNINNAPDLYITVLAHLLGHLEDDIIRFAGDPYTETEKGEQYNKFIRSNLFHINRQNTSHNIASKSGEETILRYTAQGGVWEAKWRADTPLSVALITTDPDTVDSVEYPRSDRTFVPSKISLNRLVSDVMAWYPHANQYHNFLQVGLPKQGQPTKVYRLLQQNDGGVSWTSQFRDSMPATSEAYSRSPENTPNLSLEHPTYPKWLPSCHHC
ncbi:hypothetical protein INT48_008955 [Thamnidium elegans]|uniref:Uncharacterized protein n=1 Tax=Thamnidium elegans TaxID=101142 RepID=A0A8H7SVG2_9FUNG|nr:hypothetical protein INT48_008955 [Thamnidium elegans]